MWNLNSVCININHTKAVQKMNISISKIRTCISAVKRLLVFQQSHLINFLFYSNLLYLNITSRDSTNVTIYTLSPINQAKSDLHDRVFLINNNWTRVFDKVRTPVEKCRVLFTQEMTSHNTVKYCLPKKWRHSAQQSIVYRMDDVTVHRRGLFTQEMTSQYASEYCLDRKWRHSTQMRFFPSSISSSTFLLVVDRSAGTERTAATNTSTVAAIPR